jgi:hypothetical protein
MFSRWWPRLTVVWPRSTRFTGSLRLINPAENLGRHSLPPLNRVSSRDLTTRLEQTNPTGLHRGRRTRLHFSIARIQMGKRYMVLFSLLQRSSWGSGRWMCTWKTKIRQTPPMMQRYIATSVYRRDSNISMNWSMVSDVGWGSSLGLLPSCFWRLSTKMAKQLARWVGKATTEMG